MNKTDLAPGPTKLMEEITWSEYIFYEWIDITTVTDGKRIYLRGIERKPSEMLRSAQEWDLYNKTRKVINL